MIPNSRGYVLVTHVLLYTRPLAHSTRPQTWLFLEFATRRAPRTLFYLLLQVLVHRERNRLARRDSHYPWCYAFVEGMHALLPVESTVVSTRHVQHAPHTPKEDLLEHLSSNERNSLERTHPLRRRRLLQPRLDRINGRITQRPHGAADQPNQRSLPTRQHATAAQLLLLILQQRLLEVRIRREVHGLVTSLPQRGETHTPVKRAEPFLLHHGVQRVCRVAVLGHVERVGEGVVLGLQPDLDHLHGRDDRDGLGHARGEPGQER